ncbi:MAG: beta-propeller fold lactonase family protein [Pseudomonadales bacterium]|nr:beta-propeller fold lactonase family protein [Pseudomonadales bacterium]
MMTGRLLTSLSLQAACLLLVPLAVAQNVRIVQTNSQSEVISLIDPASQSVVAEITGIPVNHGAAAAPDGSRLYFSSEAKFTLDVVDGSSLQIIREIPLSGRPNNITIGKDGRHVYVGIMQDPGGIDVIDTGRGGEKVRHIDTGSRVHNPYVTPDGKYLVAGTFGGSNNLVVYDIDTEQLAFALYPPRDDTDLEGVRPMAFETNPDGSTRRMFVQLSDFHGFTVVDFARQQEVSRILLPELPESARDPGPYNRAPAHGIGVAPDQRTLWVCSRMNGHVYAYSLPDLSYLGSVKVGSHPDWLTFSPDSRFVYVANGHSDDISVVDIQGMSEVRRLKTGQAPKRNITVVLP